MQYYLFGGLLGYLTLYFGFGIAPTLGSILILISIGLILISIGEF